jgi:hypothetical protein
MTSSTVADWFYLSFAEEEFLGGLYIEAESSVDALFRATTGGLNPGGEAAVVGPIPAELVDENVPEDHRGRLLTREEIESEP